MSVYCQEEIFVITMEGGAMLSIYWDACFGDDVNVGEN